MESINNQTFTALKNNCFYNGKTDDVLNYSSCFGLNIFLYSLLYRGASGKVLWNVSSYYYNFITSYF